MGYSATCVSRAASSQSWRLRQKPKLKKTKDLAGSGPINMYKLLPFICSHCERNIDVYSCPYAPNNISAHGCYNLRSSFSLSVIPFAILDVFLPKAVQMSILRNADLVSTFISYSGLWTALWNTPFQLPSLGVCWCDT